MTTYLQSMTEQIKATNVANGWYDDSRDFGSDIALLHSEVSEMFEAFRSWGTADTTEVCGDMQHMYEGPPKPEGIGSEAADILIRLLDTCSRYGIDLDYEMQRKMAYNKTRGYKHGGKLV